MRKGYWKTLLRNLRGRVASGFDTFTFHQTSLTVTGVLASDDDTLDPAGELPLAVTAEGVSLFIDTATGLVMLRIDPTMGSVPTGLDLPRFIESLAAGRRTLPEMSLGDAGLLDLPMPKSKSLIGD